MSVDLSAASATSSGHPELWLQFAVKDTGIGLSQEQCDNLFQAFSQADSSTSRKYGGTGLGLSIAQRLVVLMGGQIFVTSTPNVGSTFSFKIRCYQAEAPANAHTQATSTQSNSSDVKITEKVRGKILVVEDNGYNQTLARFILQHAGFTVDIAADGEQALTMVAKYSYQLILMDVHMPKLDGYAATREIRNNAAHQQIPIIALTAHVTADFHQECLASGMNDFITKPFDAKLLISKVFEWV
jgi:CheY-like chemotaxis protein